MRQPIATKTFNPAFPRVSAALAAQRFVQPAERKRNARAPNETLVGHAETLSNRTLGKRVNHGSWDSMTRDTSQRTPSDKPSKTKFTPAHGRDFAIAVRMMDEYETSRTRDKIAYIVLG